MFMLIIVNLYQKQISKHCLLLINILIFFYFKVPPPAKKVYCDTYPIVRQISRCVSYRQVTVSLQPYSGDGEGTVRI